MHQITYAIALDYQRVTNSALNTNLIQLVLKPATVTFHFFTTTPAANKLLRHCPYAGGPGMRAVFLASAAVVARNSSFEFGKPVTYTGSPLSPHAVSIPLSSSVLGPGSLGKIQRVRPSIGLRVAVKDDPQHIFIIHYVRLSLK